MTQGLTIAAWLLAAGYAFAAIVCWLRPSAPWRQVVTTVLALQTALIVVRWYLTGHPPIFGTHENTLAASWCLAVAVLWLSRGEHEAPVRLLLPWLPAHLVFGLILFKATPYPLTISERSIVVDIHVLFAWMAYSVILIGSMYAADQLISPDKFDEAGDVVFVSLALGFVAFTAMLAVGAFYSYQIFGTWYTWEITETLAAASWLGYGIAVHARLLFGWSGRKLAWLTLGLLPLLLLTFWVWSMYPGTYHHFDIIPIRPS